MSNSSDNSAALPARSTKILVVEDEGIIAYDIAAGLRRQGYEVAGIVDSGEEALRVTERVHPELVLMDIRIKGGMDGIDTAALLRERFDVPVVYLTAHSDPGSVNRAKDTGPFGYLTKPLDYSNLSATVEIALHQHRADAELRHQRFWLTTVLNSASDAIIVTDSRARIQYMNQPAEKLTGWVSSEATGLPFSLVLKLRKGETEMTELLTQALEGGERASLPRGLRAQTNSGREFQVEGEIVPSQGGTNDGAVISFRDATERLKHEQEIRHEQKMQAVGRLAAGITHDFNNLLMIILGYAEELLTTSPDGSFARKAAQEILKAAEAAAALTRQLLLFSRKQTGNAQHVDLNLVIAEAEEALRRLAGSRVEWKHSLAGDSAPVHADPSQILQVAMNLVSNARDAMPQGGILTVETINSDDGESVLLRVTDTGHGMDDEVASKLFEPFFTTKKSGQGTGLGLSIIHSIVSNLGGAIEVESAPGKGASFTICLPRAQAKAV